MICPIHRQGNGSKRNCENHMRTGISVPRRNIDSKLDLKRLRRLNLKRFRELPKLIRFMPIAIGLVAMAATSFAQTDEIQVYDAEIADPGVFNVMLHMNFTPVGKKEPSFPNAVISNNSVNGAVEWAYGV